MDMFGTLIEYVGDNRNREERLASTLASGAPGANQASTSEVGDNQTGYWDGGGYQSYFLVGVSLLGGTGVLK